MQVSTNWLCCLLCWNKQRLTFRVEERNPGCFSARYQNLVNCGLAVQQSKYPSLFFPTQPVCGLNHGPWTDSSLLTNATLPTDGQHKTMTRHEEHGRDRRYPTVRSWPQTPPPKSDEVALHLASQHGRCRNCNPPSKRTSPES